MKINQWCPCNLFVAYGWIQIQRALTAGIVSFSSQSSKQYPEADPFPSGVSYLLICYTLDSQVLYLVQFVCGTNAQDPWQPDTKRIFLQACLPPAHKEPSSVGQRSAVAGGSCSWAGGWQEGGSRGAAAAELQQPPRARLYTRQGSVPWQQCGLQGREQHGGFILPITSE